MVTVGGENLTSKEISYYATPGYVWFNTYIPQWYKRKEKLPKSIGVLLFCILVGQPPQNRDRVIGTDC